MEAKKKIGEVTFKYGKSSDFAVYSTTGVYGGWSPQGELIMSFFREMPAMPDSQTYDIMNTGELGDTPTEEQKKDVIVREVFLGISMNPLAAKNFANWLNRTVEEYERRTKLMPEGGGTQGDSGQFH